MAEPARIVDNKLFIGGDRVEWPSIEHNYGEAGDTIKILGLPTENVAHAVAASAVDIAVSSHLMTVSAGAGETIATISGGYSGMRLALIFLDTNVTITDTATEAADTVNLSAAYTSADGDVLELIYDGISWREVSRSVNG